VSQNSKQPSTTCTPAQTCTRQNLFRQPLVGRLGLLCSACGRSGRSLSLFAHLNIQRPTTHTHTPHLPLPPPFHPHLTSPHPPFNPGDPLHHHPSISLPRLLLLLSTPAFDFEGNNLFRRQGHRSYISCPVFNPTDTFAKSTGFPDERRLKTYKNTKRFVQHITFHSFIRTLLDLATASPNLAECSRTRSRIPARLFG
jgi:hypothetical protein